MRTDAGTRPQRSVTLLLLALLVTASCGESEPSTRSAGITSTVAASSGLVSLHIVSRNSPRFISSGSVSGGANGQPALWESSAVPAWLSYDLSTTPVTQRQTMLVTLLSPGSYPYLNPTQQQAFPQSFTIEGNLLTDARLAGTSDRCKQQHEFAAGSGESGRRKLDPGEGPGIE